METATLARPYARAAFEVARAAGTLDAWSQALAFAAAVAADARVAALGNDPRVAPAELVAMHRPPDIADGAPFARFLAELAEQRRLAVLPEVARLFEAFKREAESRLLVHVTSATALDAAETTRLKASLGKRYQREIALEIRVDPELLGGAVIDTGSEVIDGSVRGRLARLSATLAS